ncbi:hypothetical protein [Streptomyces sp. NPDC046887]|uniref:hypothetical protein n=1 Tax=Streptomyces sp. NPDC046887 TaxID=3155472 RepID=UPI0033C5D63A
MRIRVTVAAVSGALVLSSFAMQSAQAEDNHVSSSKARAELVAGLLGDVQAGSGKQSRAAGPVDEEPPSLGVTFSNVKVAKAIKVGTTKQVTSKVTYTMKHPAGLKITAKNFVTLPILYRGSDDMPDNMAGGDAPATCKAVTSTTASCTGRVDFYPADGWLLNSDAGTWKVSAAAATLDGNEEPTALDHQKRLGTTLVQRNSTLTVNAAPEPVKKGKKITVTGKLARANWETNKYAGYTGQPVKLQFRKKNASSYTTVATVKTNNTGELKATRTAVEDGYWRWSFAGTSTTNAITTAGDFVDVK